VSRIAVAGVIIASTAIGGGVAVNMGVLDTLDSADKNTRITTTHVDLATFTARTVMGNERRGQIPVKIVLQSTGLRTAKVICRTSSNLRKAILRDLYRNPIPLKRDNALELSKTKTRLLKVTNGVMRGDLISDVIVINESAKTSPDSSILANLLNCRKLLALSGTKKKRRRR
jgi:hypothetical protein